ncbi:hypothetical protein FACS1894201_04230 [Bacteroidia bacterium]|nr:hypothetical protein FACS1894201_04230 [Bacteroidia bacterium]
MTKIVTFLSLFFLGFCVNMLLVGMGFNVYVNNVLSQLCTWFLPACGYLVITHQQPIHYLKLDRFTSTKTILWSLAFVVTIYVVLDRLDYWNQQIVLPDSLHVFRELEDKSIDLIRQLLGTDTSLSNFMRSLFLMAVLPALCEEIFFRGVIQNALLHKTRRTHLAIWLAALIFSAIHLQFYGFFSRWLLGAMLGYLYVFTQSLWIPIIVHFLNNAITVIVYFIYLNQWLPIDDPFSVSTPVFPIYITLLGCALSVYLMVRMAPKLNNE